jgi:hypothetical protein
MATSLKIVIISTFPSGVILPDTQRRYLSSENSSARQYQPRNFLTSRVIKITFCLYSPAELYSLIYNEDISYQDFSARQYPSRNLSSSKGHKDNILSLSLGNSSERRYLSRSLFASGVIRTTSCLFPSGALTRQRFLWE